MQEDGDTMVPSPWRLLQPVKRTGEQAHEVRMLGVDKTNGLLTEHLLGKVTVQEGVGDIQLMHMPDSRDRQLKHGADRARFHKWSESVGEVYARALPKSTNHPSSLVALKRTIRAGLVVEHPLASDDIGMTGSRNKMPRAVALQGVKLFLHRYEPVEIPKGSASRGGDG